MNYAIIEISGFQAWVEEGQFLVTNSLPAKCGEKILFKRVLLRNKNSNIEVGYPYLQESNVVGHVTNHFHDTKIIVYKMKSKKKFRRKMGHRQKKNKNINK